MGEEGANELQQNRLYHELAYLWPIISPPEEYLVEAWHCIQALRSKLGPGQFHILELGVGGGHNLSHLTRDFRATAVDISEEMLALSRKLNPGVAHFQGDMRNVRLGNTFDAVLIHDAIIYMLTEEDLRATFATAKAHLRPGGVLLVAPDWFKEAFTSPSVSQWTRYTEELELTFMEYAHDPDPTDTTMESIFIYFIKQGGELRVEMDRHITGLFPSNTWMELLEEAGFLAERLSYPAYEGGYGGNLLVGVLQV